MNQLSWLLYWADVLPSLSAFIAVLMFFGCGASVILLVFHFVGGEETRGYKFDGTDPRYMEPDLHKYTDDARTCQKLWWAKLSLPICFILWGSAFLIPDKDTFYMIAASEAGEQAVQTPEFAKIRGVINKWLDEQNQPAAK